MITDNNNLWIGVNVLQPDELEMVRVPNLSSSNVASVLLSDVLDGGYADLFDKKNANLYINHAWNKDFVVSPGYSTSCPWQVWKMPKQKENESVIVWNPYRYIYLFLDIGNSSIEHIIENIYLGFYEQGHTFLVNVTNSALLGIDYGAKVIGQMPYSGFCAATEESYSAGKKITVIGIYANYDLQVDDYYYFALNEGAFLSNNQVQLLGVMGNHGGLYTYKSINEGLPNPSEISTTYQQNINSVSFQSASGYVTNYVLGSTPLGEYVVNYTINGLELYNNFRILENYCLSLGREILIQNSLTLTQFQDRDFVVIQNPRFMFTQTANLVWEVQITGQKRL